MTDITDEMLDDASAVYTACRLWLKAPGNQLHPETLLSELKYPASIFLDKVSVKEIIALLDLAQISTGGMLD